jgi:hypothetical protein
MHLEWSLGHYLIISRREKIFVLIGYGLSTISKPFFAFSTSWIDAVIDVDLRPSGMMVWTALDNKIYQIIFKAEKSKFDDNLLLVLQMTDSLQIQALSN